MEEVDLHEYNDSEEEDEGHESGGFRQAQCHTQ